MKKKEISTVNLGKVPPQALDLEIAVLGAVMLEKNAFDQVMEILKPEYFYSQSHQNIYSAMMVLAQRNQQIDLLTVVEQLRKDGNLETAGGPAALTKLTMSVISATNIETHSRIILERYMQRELILMGMELTNKGYNETSDAFEMIDEHEKRFTELTTKNIHGSYSSMENSVFKNITHISDLRQTPGRLTGVPSGFEDIDRVTHGWQNTDLIILAARPSVGKTALSLNIARNAAKKVPVAFFSLEMSTSQLINRLLSAESEIYLECLRNGIIDDEQMKNLTSSASVISSLNIFIDDTAAINVFQLRTRARTMKRKHNIGMIIIDYLQLMTGIDNKSGREQEIAKISRDLKALAKDLNIPIIALSQLSRKTEERKGEQKMPQLSDLRESGAIEQDADVVAFMYRPDYYDQNAATENGDLRKGETILKIAKHRNGSLAEIKLRARLEIQKFFTYVEDLHVPMGSNWKPVAEINQKIESKKQEFQFDKKDDLPF